ncbi:MAG TPA: acyltransferase [Terracidiphilus sp.]|nr:acyltransferase [Terracidiphilus sp.]
MKDNHNLDLLRAIAVILVVVEHILLAMHVQSIASWNVAWIGVVGVFFFFVHTSLVLMWSLDRRPSVLDFYLRRFFRIYPLAMAVILATLAFHLPTMQSPNGDTFFRSPGFRLAISNLLLVQNVLWRGNILGVMWTLPLEVDMYFLLPYLYFFVKRERRLWPFLMLWIATAIYDRATFPADDNTFVACMPYFLSGVLAYLLFSRRVPQCVPVVLMPVLLLGLLSAFMAHPSFRNGWFLTLITGLALPFFRPLRTKWIASISHQIAKYSYGIYLIHPFSIALGINYLHNYNLAFRIIVVISSLVALVVPAYHLLEKPMIDFGARLAKGIADPENGDVLRSKRINDSMSMPIRGSVDH